MKSYLGLVLQSARVHKKQNRLTVLCIAISVMLVTAIFGMADMSIRAQIKEYIKRSGNFHAILTGISDQTAVDIDDRDDVNVSGWMGMTEDILYKGKAMAIQSGKEAFTREMNVIVAEGRYPESSKEALIDRQGLVAFGLSLGDTISFEDHGGQWHEFMITGTYHDFSGLKAEDAHGLLLAPEGIRTFLPDQYQEYDYIQFKQGTNIDRALSEIRAEYGLTEEQISVNTTLLRLMGQGSDDAIKGVYATAAILFVLVAAAGTLMIASSFNMSVQARTQFFGLLRCLGATKKQVRRYIRLEGLLYSLKGTIAGLLAGSLMMWLSFFALNMLKSPFLPEFSMFEVSWPGIAAGAMIGVLVVMIASGSPAKNASKVSAHAAVTGNISRADSAPVMKASNTRMFRVATAMGIQHAWSNKKNLFFITGSFAVSIVLFLSFSVFITFMNYSINPLKPYAPDLSITGADHSVRLPSGTMEQLAGLPHIKQIYGRMTAADIPASDGKREGTVLLLSYDDTQFDWAEDMLVEGSVDRGAEGQVLVDYAYSKEFGWKTGDMITLSLPGESRQVTIGGILSDMPFQAEGEGWVLICSETAFTDMTGISDYTIIDMQVSQDNSSQVRELLPADLHLRDRQQSNQEVKGSYYAMAVFVYGFLLVIALVALINIINTINSGVSCRLGNYGVMRAVGMSVRQMKKVIAAEAAVYAVIGSIAGSVAGLAFHRYFFGLLVTANWGTLWKPPVMLLVFTVLVSLCAALLSTLWPAKKVGDMRIVAVVNAEES